MSQGGGFYATQSSPFGGSPGGGSIEKTEISHSIRPLTIAQFWKATQAHTDAEWTVDSVEIGQVTIVGQVVTINKQTTNCQYSIEDGTGSMEARHWVDSNNEEDSLKWGTIEENTYVRVTGNVKAFNGRRYINANSIRPVQDPHEVYFHILECVYVTMMLKNGSPTASGGAQPAQNVDSKTSMSAYTAQSSGRADENPEYTGLPAIQRQILRVILEQPEHDEGGVHVGTIAKALNSRSGQNIAANVISDALDQLMDAGHIYSTSDEQHFQVSQ